ncbi:MAG TPA: hypothetical protein VHL34_13225 [Rhizomicrobium sp.]|jgi:hypothetical protein|nr:hypothetical protein [Rhizomicrobium sp.]
MNVGARHIPLSLVVSGAAALLILIVGAVIPGAWWMIAAIPAVVFAVLAFSELRSAEYSWIASAVVCVSFLAIPDMVWALAKIDGPVWLSLTLLGLCAAARRGIAVPSVQAIMAMGACLALMLLVDPIGVVFLAGFIIVLVVQPQLRRNSYDQVSLAILVAAAPLMCVALLWLSHVSVVGALSPLQVTIATLGLRSPVPPLTMAPYAVLTGLCAVVPALIAAALLPSMRGSGSPLLSMLVLVVAASFALSELQGTRHQMFWLTASVLPVAIVLLASLKISRLRSQVAIATSLLSVGTSWVAYLL